MKPSIFSDKTPEQAQRDGRKEVREIRESERTSRILARKVFNIDPDTRSLQLTAATSGITILGPNTTNKGTEIAATETRADDFDPSQLPDGVAYIGDRRMAQIEAEISANSLHDWANEPHWPAEGYTIETDSLDDEVDQVATSDNDRLA